MKTAGRKQHLLTPEERDSFIDMVVDIASDFLFIDREDILCGGPNTMYTLPRQIIMYVVKEVKPVIGFKIISNNLNIKDHATVVYGIRRMKDIIERPSMDMVIHSKIMDVKRAVQNTVLGSDSEYQASLELDKEAEMILNLSPMYTWDVKNQL